MHTRAIKLNVMLKYELAAAPTSIFYGIQTDDDRFTTTTASCPLSYEEQGPAD